MEIEEGPAAAALEQLDAAPVDAERALALRRGRDLGHRVPSPLWQVGRPREARAHQKGVAGETPSRIMRDLEWKPSIALRDGLEQTVAFYRRAGVA